MKAAKTVPMITAAATTTRPIAAIPCSTASRVVQAVDVLLADAAHEEDHVVHREPEEDREGDRGHERLDRPRPVEPRQARAGGPPASTSVSTPKPMKADRSVVTAAVSEITIERNAIASTMNVTPMM